VDRPLTRAAPRIAHERAVYGFAREYGAPGDPLGRRERVGWLAAAIVDAAYFTPSSGFRARNASHHRSMEIKRD
jgi:hypothetical protein